MTTKAIVHCLLLLVSIVIIHGFRIPLPTTAAPPPLRLAKRNDSNDDVVAATQSKFLLLSDQQKQLSRRQIGELSFAAIGLTASYLGTRENTPQDYGLWGVLPVGPYKRKKTIMESIVPDTIWTFDQKVCVCFFHLDLIGNATMYNWLPYPTCIISSISVITCYTYYRPYSLPNNE